MTVWPDKARWAFGKAGDSCNGGQLPHHCASTERREARLVSPAATQSRHGTILQTLWSVVSTDGIQHMLERIQPLLRLESESRELHFLG